MFSGHENKNENSAWKKNFSYLPIKKKIEVNIDVIFIFFPVYFFPNTCTQPRPIHHNYLISQLIFIFLFLSFSLLYSLSLSLSLYLSPSVSLTFTFNFNFNYLLHFYFYFLFILAGVTDPPSFPKFPRR